MAASELKLISWTALVVVILGVASVLTLLQPPDGMATVASREPATAARSLASIPASAPVEIHPSFKSAAVELQTIDIKAPCKAEEPIKIAETIREIRLSGASCAGSAKVVTTEIKNVSNGFIATVFKTSAKAFTTDYVTLAKGTNRILVREELASGKINEREYQITRN